MQFRTICARALLTLSVGVMLVGALPARAADNDGLATEFGGFGAGGMVSDAPLEINEIALQPDSNIVAVGTRNNSFAVARYLPHGVLDTSFGANGLVVTPISDTQQRAVAHGVAVEADGKIVVVGTVFLPGGSDIAALRYTASAAMPSPAALVRSGWRPTRPAARSLR